MYNIERSIRINQIVGVFHRFFVWRNGKETFCLDITRKLLFQIFYMTFPISLALGGFLSDDENEAVYLVAAAIPQVVNAVKLAYILWKKKEISEFLDDSSAHSIANYDEFIQISNKLNFLIKFSTCFVSANVMGMATIVFLSLPVFTREKRLPVNVAFPLDWKNNLFSYWLAYAYFASNALLSMIIISFNPVIWYLMLNFSIKYQILGNELRKMGEGNTASEKSKCTHPNEENLFLQKFIMKIGAHQNIRVYYCVTFHRHFNKLKFFIRTIDRFKSFFATLYFTQITTSGICICLAVFALAFGTNEDLFQTAINCMLLVYNLFDIFMVMYLGNEIKIFSNRLSCCLFESNWMDQSMLNKNCIIILAEVLKRPQELVIAKLYPLDLKTFTSILNLAYSMFNILRNME